MYNNPTQYSPVKKTAAKPVLCILMSELKITLSTFPSEVIGDGAFPPQYTPCLTTFPVESLENTSILS